MSDPSPLLNSLLGTVEATLHLVRKDIELYGLIQDTPKTVQDVQERLLSLQTTLNKIKDNSPGLVGSNPGAPSTSLDLALKKCDELVKRLGGRLKALRDELLQDRVHAFAEHPNIQSDVNELQGFLQILNLALTGEGV